MNIQLSLFKGTEPINQADIVYTPDYIACDIVKYFKPFGKCLDPCKGNGVFLRYLPPNSDWCEIKEGRDFFEYNKQVDWIVSNPPYSIFSEWIQHSFRIAYNIVYLMPIMKLLGAQERLEKIYMMGGIVAIRFYGKGTDNGFHFGWPVGAVHFQKNYIGDIKISFALSSNTRSTRPVGPDRD